MQRHKIVPPWLKLKLFHNSTYSKPALNVTRKRLDESYIVIPITGEGGCGTCQALNFLPGALQQLPFHEPTAERGKIKKKLHVRASGDAILM
ncbi:hypothetical protein WN55_06995 [Dufourea novaeangliae]|uniref:Uncharacterized protein n=1 Tax=Dufourea novaeangliae TaxID=178035 RepID=A0A154P111_DUFNO|nr:hypothetical protein WN55_06995 [Dufourea novaeangliae]